MDQTPPPAAAAPAAAPAAVLSPEAVSPVELPWEVEPAPAPPRPRKVAQAVVHTVAPERLHWPMIVLTAVTAITLVFATRANQDTHIWEFPSPAEQVR